MKTKHVQKSDFFFLTLTAIGIGIFLVLMRTMPTCIDETFYPTVAFRLINGDSLITDEWHLSQFSSLFLYLPVRIWLAIKGSTDGLIIYMRCVFLVLHTLTAFIVYGKFRKHGIWAVFASSFFFLQAPMRVYSLSYNSLFAFFLLLLGLLFFSIYENQKPVYYVLAGVCYGAACVCNPFFCLVFPAYFFACLLLPRLQKPKKGKKVRNFSLYPIFFEKKCFWLLFCGIATVALVAIVFFFATGGTAAGLTVQIPNLLTDAEHDIFANPVTTFLHKVWDTCKKFNKISLNLPFLLPALYIAIIFDKKKYNNSHRIIYLLLSIAFAVFYAVTIKNISEQPNSFDYFFWSLPFLIISTVSLLLTKQKNKQLFFCFWIPCALASIAQYLASNLHLNAIGWVMTVANVAGVCFVKDLFCELKNEKEETKKCLQTIVQALLCLGICFNLAILCTSLCYDLPKTYSEPTKEITTGTYSGILIEKKLYGSHTLLQKDLAEIRERSDENDNVLIISEMCWLQLEMDRPMAAYSAWQLSFEPERMQAYFEQNPDKKPKYIYVDAMLNSAYAVSFPMAEFEAGFLKNIFTCSEEKLSRGILLTVLE